MMGLQQQVDKSLIPWDANGMWRERIIAFNLDPLSYIHPDRLKDEVFQELNSIDGMSTLYKSRLSTLLRQQMNLNDNFCFDFRPQVRRLALLDIETIINLEKRIGIIFYARQVKQTVVRSKYIKAIKELGKELYDFCIYRSMFYKINNQEAERLKISEISLSNCVTVGHLLLCHLLSHEPAGLLKRFHLRFAKTIKPENIESMSHLSKVHLSWSTIQQLLIREIEPGLKKCLN